MDRRSIDAEVGCWLVWPADLGSHACVARLQPPIRQPGPVAADFGIERLPTRRVDPEIVRIIGPLHVGTELGLPTQIDREVHTQAGQVLVRLGGGVNQSFKRRSPAGKGEVVPFGVPGTGHMGSRQARCPLRHHTRGQSCGI